MILKVKVTETRLWTNKSNKGCNMQSLKDPT